MFHSAKIILRFFSFLCWISLSCPFLGFCTSACYELTFHNVGQGNCTVIKSPRRQVLIVDAGSSNTTGVEEIPTEGKYKALADKIFTSIKDDLEASKWLWFVVSHPDKDHLNLVIKIIEQSNLLDKTERRVIDGTSIGILLGGERNIYKTGDSNALIRFLLSYSIPCFFGAEDYKAQLRPGVMYEPREVPSKILRGWEGKIDFLSVDGNLGAVRKVVKKRTAVSAFGEGSGAGSGDADDSSATVITEKEDDTNKVSIVMKVYCGPFSVMLTGDKTKKETYLIIDRFKGKESALQSDVLLATHHGSWDDYVPEWVEYVNPRYVVFSSGRSYDHPRSRTVDGYIAKAGNLAPYPWHFIQFQGDFINQTHSFGKGLGSGAGAGSSSEPSSSLVVKSLAREAPSSIEKARGYVHAVMNKGIFVTANQGDITFLQDGSVRISGLTHADLSTFPTDLVRRFLSAPTLLDGTRVEIEELNFDGETSLVPLLPALETLPSLDDLQKLSVKSLGLTDADVDGMCSLISGRTGVTNLDLTGNGFSEGSKEKIREAWGHRGLRL